MRKVIIIIAACCLAYSGCVRSEISNQSNEEFWQKAAIEQPNDFKAQMLFGIAQKDAHNLKGAETTVQRAVSLRPNNAPGHKVLGDIYSLQGKHQLAQEEWRTAMKTANGRQTREIEPLLTPLNPQGARAAR